MKILSVFGRACLREARHLNKFAVSGSAGLLENGGGNRDTLDELAKKQAGSIELSLCTFNVTLFWYQNDGL